ncbi:MAG: flippase-like domain-containing protein [Anaerolineales bacterium]|nr:flippase-like domain-containing protein [Anaerolineales bacterium]
MKSYLRKHLSTIIKVLVTVVGLAIVVGTVDLSEVGSLLLTTDWRWVGLAFVLVLISLVLRAYRWLLLLRGLGTKLRFGRLVELYFVGSFFNAFLPAGLGGDAIRIIEVAHDVPADIAAGTVIVDRMSGLMMQFLVVLIVLPFRPDNFPSSLTWLLTGVSLVGLVGGMVLLEGSLIRRFGRFLPAKLSPVGEGPIAKLLAAVQGCGWPAIIKAMLVSMLFNLMLLTWWWADSRALAYAVPYTYFFLAVPIMSIALLLPSIGGLGTREVLAPMLFGPAGLNDHQAVALSLLVFITLRLAGLIGAPVYLWTLWRKRG